jgi:hypothetical protein
MSLDDLTVEEFKRLYYEELFTEAEIADRLGTYQVAINRFRNRHQLPALGKTGRIERQLPDLTDLQRNILVGSLLGDGSMAAPSPITARFSEGHSLAQRSYTDWKAEILADYVSQRYESVKHKDGRTYESWNFATRTTTRLRPYFDLFYGSGVRVFPDSLPTLMNPLVLAVWYLDDGGIMQKFHPRIAFGLDDLSLERALAGLRALGFRPTVHEEQKCRTIAFPGQDLRFYDMVRPHVPPCMAYKLPVLSSRKIKDENARRLTVDVAQHLAAQGISVTEIARHFGVGRATAKRRLDGEIPKRMGRPARNR